jgi:hypothetical protein
MYHEIREPSLLSGPFKAVTYRRSALSDQRVTMAGFSLTTDNGLRTRIDNPPAFYGQQAMIHCKVIRNFTIIIYVQHNQVGLFAGFD